MNPKFNKMGLRGKIEAKIDRLKGAKHNDDEIREAIGIIVHDALFEKEDQPTPVIIASHKPNDGGNNEPGKKRQKVQRHRSAKDSGGKDGKSNSVNSEPGGGDEENDERSSIAEFYPVNRKDLTRVKKLLKQICKRFNKIDSEYKPKRELSSTEAEELWEKISDLNSILTKFKRALHKAVFGK